MVDTKPDSRPRNSSGPAKLTSSTPDFSTWSRLPRRHPGRVVSGAIVLGVFAAIVYAFANGKIEWQVVGEFLTADAILHGLVNTITITLAAMLLGIVLGIVFAVMRLSSNPVARSAAQFYVWFFRGVPVYLQLLLWFNIALIFPTFGIPGIYEARMIDVMTAFMAALLGLGLNQGAYTSEVVRAGILSVDKGQAEAAQSVGMTSGQILRRVTIPQAMRFIVPPVGNEFIGMLKNSSLAAVITYAEMLHSAQLIYYVNNRIMELLIVCAIWYLVAVSILSIIQHFVERYYSKGFTRPRKARANRTTASIKTIQGEEL